MLLFFGFLCRTNYVLRLTDSYWFFRYLAQKDEVVYVYKLHLLVYRLSGYINKQIEPTLINVNEFLPVRWSLSLLKISLLSAKPKVHCCVLKLLLLKPIPIQLNPTYNFTGSFCKIQFIITFLPKHEYYMWLFRFRLSYRQTCKCKCK